MCGHLLFQFITNIVKKVYTLKKYDIMILYIIGEEDETNNKKFIS